VLEKVTIVDTDGNTVDLNELNERPEPVVADEAAQAEPAEAEPAEAVEAVEAETSEADAKA
jgi:trigger factor